MWRGIKTNLWKMLCSSRKGFRSSRCFFEFHIEINIFYWFLTWNLKNNISHDQLKLIYFVFFNDWHFGVPQQILKRHLFHRKVIECTAGISLQWSCKPFIAENIKINLFIHFLVSNNYKKIYTLYKHDFIKKYDFLSLRIPMYCNNVITKINNP